MPIYYSCAQRSAEWFLLRLGKPTASDFHRIVTPKGKLSAQSRDYCCMLLAEQMLGRSLADQNPRTEWMERGERLEEGAIKAYSMLREVEVQPGGFVTDSDGRYGCSPDGLTNDGGVEMKIPAPNTHVGYLLNPDSLREEKGPQVQGSMLVCDREHWDLVSYHEEMPPVIVRVKRDDPYVQTLRESLDAFCDTLEVARAKLEAMYGKFPEPKIFDPGAKCDSCRATYESVLIGAPCQCGGTIVAKGDPGSLGIVPADLEVL